MPAQGQEARRASQLPRRKGELMRREAAEAQRKPQSGGRAAAGAVPSSIEGRGGAAAAGMPEVPEPLPPAEEP